jgi:predicted nucleic acid-binding protein
MRGSTTILVVADTSPLNYLIQIDCQELLTTLYQRILIPGAVLGELMHVRTPAKVRAWLRSRRSGWRCGKSLHRLIRPWLGLVPGNAKRFN